MLRFAIAVFAVIAVTASHPVFADPVAAVAGEHTQAAAPVTDPPVPPASSTDAASSTGFGKGVVPAGIGWG
jgi:hypothetical protein